MKVSENWLREWVNPSLDGQQLASLLTMAGLEVDALNPVAGVFEGVVVAEVIKTTPHPQADKLSLCDVNNGSGQLLKIVCGAFNVRAGLKVALAEIGAKLPGGLKIKEAKLRGELSQGMLCSMTELGLSDSSDGIIELDEDAPVGTNLRTYLSLDDQVMDIDLTPNRADCLSVLGIAREVGALTGIQPAAMSKVTLTPEIDEQKSVQLQAGAACPRYCGRVIRNINSQAKTPLWMRERLRRSGIRSIHAVVDVLNYVMLEFGQPMHAFDLNKLKGDITVRFSQKDEALELLDGQQITVKENILLVADSQQPLAIAGVMGGRSSAVDDNTTDIFLESAWFNPITIAGVARQHGLFTDSSQRFERGVDPELQDVALERATALILDITGGTIGPISQVFSPEYQPGRTVILFYPEKVKQLTGIEISEITMAQSLTNLGLSVVNDVLPWQVQVPSHRFDLHLDVDLIEEIIRLYGYDKISGEKMIAAVSAGTINPLELLSMKIANFFAARGYHETISYSFVDPELQTALYPDVPALTLLNPISSELSQMRVGMLPGLIASMIYNTHRQQTVIKFFEHGVIFEHNNGKTEEFFCAGALLTGEYGSLNWCESARKFDFYDLKGDLQALFASLQLSDIKFEAANHSAMHPGKSAKIMIGDQQAGWLGVLHPRIADALDINEEVIFFDLKLSTMLADNLSRYQQTSKFPQIRRDLSLLVNDNISIAELDDLVRQTVKPEWLKSFDVFDVYTGGTIPAGKKSLAIALTHQNHNRT